MKKILIAGAALTLILSGCTLGSFTKSGSSKELTIAEAKTKATAFINENLMQAGSEAVIGTTTKENGLFKISVSLPQGKTIEAYMTVDGKQFFPQVIDMEKFAAENGAKADANKGSDQAAAAPVKKSKKPVVEAFVMSYCPYGTQIEKGLIPAVKALGSSVDFKIRFVDYAMHGKKEVDENLLQYCVQSEQNAKFFDYLGCFLKSSDSASCVKSAKLDEGKLNSCIAASDKKFNVTKNFEDKSTYKGSYASFDIDKELVAKYGVQGSPTLVINGGQSEAGRDSASLLKAICDAMDKPAKECSTKLSSAAPAPGFGEGAASDGTAAAGCAQ